MKRFLLSVVFTAELLVLVGCLGGQKGNSGTGGEFLSGGVIATGGAFASTGGFSPTGGLNVFSGGGGVFATGGAFASTGGISPTGGVLVSGGAIEPDRRCPMIGSDPEMFPACCTADDLCGAYILSFPGCRDLDSIRTFLMTIMSGEEPPDAVHCDGSPVLAADAGI